MTQPIYHILNGDALAERFPSALPGQRIICRECLIDGPVSAPDRETFYQQRAQYLIDIDGISLPQEYLDYATPELDRIYDIDHGSEVYLWFEDDLFCQVNMWYIVHELPVDVSLYVVRPDERSPYGYHRYDEAQLIQLYQDREALTNVELISELWEAFAERQHDKILKLRERLSSSSQDYIKSAIDLHMTRTSYQNEESLLHTRIKSLLHQNENNSFKGLFRAFCAQYPAYGYGDLQFRVLYDQLKK